MNLTFPILHKKTTMKELYNQTKTDWRILACRAGITDCSVKNTWQEKLYQEGNCKAYRPQVNFEDNKYALLHEF